MTTVAIAILLGGLVIFLASLPLACRKIPMNQVYGIRVRASFESEQRWYDINAYGGRRMAAWSVLIIMMGVLGFFVPKSSFLVYAWTSAAVTLAAVLIPAIQTFRWSRKRDTTLLE